MPLWLDLLRTPMAAPETDRLRHMRRTWQVLCVSSGATVLAIAPLVARFGHRATLAIAVLLAVTLVHSALYLVRKHRADEAYLEAAGDDAS